MCSGQASPEADCAGQHHFRYCLDEATTNLISRIQQGLEAQLGEFPLLLEGLEAAAARGVAAAHLATAYMLEPYGDLPDEDHHRFGRELQRHDQWSSEPVSFAEVAADTDSSFAQVVAKQRYHLLAAARGGDKRAMLLIAERYGDTAALGLEPSDEMNPYSMADLADDHGRPDLAHQRLTTASHARAKYPSCASSSSTGARHRSELGFGCISRACWVRT